MLCVVVTMNPILLKLLILFTLYLLAQAGLLGLRLIAGLGLTLCEWLSTALPMTDHTQLYVRRLQARTRDAFRELECRVDDWFEHLYKNF